MRIPINDRKRAVDSLFTYTGSGSDYSFSDGYYTYTPSGGNWTYSLK